MMVNIYNENLKKEKKKKKLGLIASQPSILMNLSSLLYVSRRCNYFKPRLFFYIIVFFWCCNISSFQGILLYFNLSFELCRKIFLEYYESSFLGIKPRWRYFNFRYFYIDN